jgi:hypothetical protein
VRLGQRDIDEDVAASLLLELFRRRVVVIGRATLATAANLVMADAAARLTV